MSLAATYQPRLVSLVLPGLSSVLLAAKQELIDKTKADANKCMGYFPGLKKSPLAKAVDFDFPSCREFAEAFPSVQLGNETFMFNFVRMSLVRQAGDFPFHLDTDAASAMGGTEQTIATKEVWRILLNMSDTGSRKLEYIDQPSEDFEIEFHKGYLHTPDKEALNFVRSVDLLPRRGDTVSAVVLCASKVLHTGRDDDKGHFVAGYGFLKNQYTPTIEPNAK